MRIRSIVRRPLARGAVLAGCIASAGGCMSWQHTPAPAPAASRALHDPIRVTRNDGYAIELTGAEVRGDSIIGLERASHRRVSLALADVRAAEARRVDVLHSALTGVGVAATVFSAGVLALLAILSSDNS